MSEFEDNLWRDVVSEHGDDLAQAKWPPPPRRGPRPRVLAGTTVVLAAAAAVIALVLGGTGTTPAYAVTANHDGSITLAINRLNGIHAANVKLSALGVRAMAVQVPAACRAAIAVARFNPRRIPRGKVLVIGAWRDGHAVRLSSARIGRAGVAGCLPAIHALNPVRQQVPIRAAAVPCTVSGPPANAPLPPVAGGGTGTDTGTTASTGTQTTQATGTQTSQAAGTTGTGTTGTGTTGAPVAMPPRTVAIPCGYQQRLHATPQQVKRALALTQAARRNPGKACNITIAQAPRPATAPTSTVSSQPPPATVVRCRQPASK